MLWLHVSCAQLWEWEAEVHAGCGRQAAAGALRHAQGAACAEVGMACTRRVHTHGALCAS